MSDLPEHWQELPSQLADDLAARLIAAICASAYRDAAKGNLAAQQWLMSLRNMAEDVIEGRRARQVDDEEAI